MSDDLDDDERRYSLRPIADLLGVELGRIGGSQPGQPPAGLAALAEALHVSDTMAQRMHSEGLSVGQADKYACALGYHPSVLWPEWWRHVEPEPDFYAPEHDPIRLDGDLIFLDTGGTEP